MTIQQVLLGIRHRIKVAPRRTKIIGGIVFLSVVSCALIYGIDEQVAYDYTDQVCVNNLTLFPQIAKAHPGSGYDVSFTDTIAVMGASLASLKTCFTPTEQPRQGTHRVSISPFGGIFARKDFSIKVAEMRSVSQDDFVGKTLPTTRPVELKLSGPDTVFRYLFKVDEETVDCVVVDTTLSCDISKLGLGQGKNYTGAVTRYYGEDTVGDIASGTFSTLMPLLLESATVSEGQTIYDAPTALVFGYDKTVLLAETELLVKNGEIFEQVGSKTTIEGNKVNVVPDAPLKRDAQFEVILKKVEAEDGSAIADAHSVKFAVSGGPKVTGVSVGSISAPQSGSIVLTFDQEIANVDKIPSLVSIQGVGASVAKKGNSLVITYTSAPRCGDIKITVHKGFTSAYDISQDTEWGFATRTVCYSVRTIGYSSKGRAIQAWIFGSGSKTILYTGAIHGSEQNTKTLMNSWINELEAGARNIPSGVQIVVIPSVNPDGVAVNTRANANNVDLNRNFDTSDWKRDVVTTSGQSWQGGGGSAPNSESETKALVSYTSALQPYLTMSYHSTGGYAIGNGCGSSSSLAATYSAMTGYANMTGNNNAFSYEITGTYDDWICERLGRQSVLIELASGSSSEFGRNKAALWAMARS